MYQFLYFPLSGEQYVLVYPYARINLLLRNYFLHLLVCTSLYSLDIYVEVLIKITCVWFYRGVRGAVWFGFEVKSHPNCKINKYAVWFGSVNF